MNRHCFYHPVKGTQCPKRASIGVARYDHQIAVCADHVQRYIENGWTRVQLKTTR